MPRRRRFSEQHKRPRPDQIDANQSHEIPGAFRGLGGGLLLDLEWGEGAEALGVSKDGVLRLILVVAADEGAVEARQGVHGWRGRVVGAEEEVTRRGELEWDGSGTRPPGPGRTPLR
jgi:hypothetical protein